MSQVVPDARALPADIPAAAEDRSAAPTPGRQPSRVLLTAWLLLLLEAEPTHGYELRRRLEAHGVKTEAGAMYRTLRKLEQDGHTTSTWMKSGIGPRRRYYRLTPQGRRQLDERVAHITVERDVRAAFLQARERMPRAPAPPASAAAATLR